MRVDCALLCDAATVREGLLHVLGGGITRVNRPAYPAPLDTMLAVRVMARPTELGKPHTLELLLNDDDGKMLAKVDLRFGVMDPSLIPPGEEASIPMPLRFPGVMLPKAGTYVYELRIDGNHQVSVPFQAVTVALPPTPPT